MKQASEKDSTIIWFWFLLSGHVVLWTTVPLLTQSNGPLDSIEMIFWGSHWQFGYYKHPPLPAWIAQAGTYLPGGPVWPVYFFSQLSIATCFWAAWKMGREHLTPWTALASAFILEAVAYYNYSTPEFNNTMMSRAGWALIALFSYWAMTKNKTIYWIAAGVACAGSMLSIYNAVLIILSIIGFSLIHPQARKHWQTPGPYILTLVGLLLFSPHLMWLIEHDFPTLGFLNHRTQSSYQIVNHLLKPLDFLKSQLLALGLLFLLATLLLTWKWKIKTVSEEAQFHRLYLLAVGTGPLSLALLFSMFTGANLVGMWGAPMFTFLGVLLFSWFEPQQLTDNFPLNWQNKKARTIIRAAIVTSCVIAVGLAVRNTIGSSFRENPLRIDFPGQELANKIEKLYQDYQPPQAETKKIYCVGGDWWLAGNVNVYSKQKPQVYIKLVPEFSPWISDAALKKHGGVILWYPQQDYLYLPEIQKRFPEAHLHGTLTFNRPEKPFHRDYEIQVAVIPAEDQIQQDPYHQQPAIMASQPGENQLR